MLLKTRLSLRSISVQRVRILQESQPPPTAGHHLPPQPAAYFPAYAPPRLSSVPPLTVHHPLPPHRAALPPPLASLTVHYPLSLRPAASPSSRLSSDLPLTAHHPLPPHPAASSPPCPSSGPPLTGRHPCDCEAGETTQRRTCVPTYHRQGHGDCGCGGRRTQGDGGRGCQGGRHCGAQGSREGVRRCWDA